MMIYTVTMSIVVMDEEMMVEFVAGVVARPLVMLQKTAQDLFVESVVGVISYYMDWVNHIY